MPLITVIVPCYNTAPDIMRQTILSIENQDVDVEILIVDDGSTDPKSLEYLKKLKHRVLTQENSGLPVALNLGLKEARGKYTIEVDSDDILTHGALKRMIEPMEKDETVALVWGDLEIFGTENIPRRHSLPEWDIYTLLHFCPVPVSTLMRTQVLKDIGGWDETRLFFQDWNLWLKFASSGYRGKHVDYVTLKYRTSHSGLHHQRRDKYGQRIEYLKKNHASLFAQKSEFRKISLAPKKLIFAFEVISHLPIEPLKRAGLYRFAAHKLFLGDPENAAHYFPYKSFI